MQDTGESGEVLTSHLRVRITPDLLERLRQAAGADRAESLSRWARDLLDLASHATPEARRLAKAELLKGAEASA